MSKVKRGVSVLSMPARLLSRCCCAVVKSTAGMPLPISPTTARYFHSLIFIFLNAVSETGRSKAEAMPMRKAATCSGANTGWLKSSLSACFIRMNELPQVRASRAMAARWRERGDCFSMGCEVTAPWSKPSHYICREIRLLCRNILYSSFQLLL